MKPATQLRTSTNLMRAISWVPLLLYVTMTTATAQVTNASNIEIDPTLLSCARALALRDSAASVKRKLAPV
jgi:hypothetical protein